MMAQASSNPFWDDKFAGDAHFYGTQPNDFVRAQAGIFAKGGQVLSIGEGEGRNAVFLAEQGYAVTALDASKVGLAKVARLAAARGVRVETVFADLTHYTFDENRWDGIVSIFCHLPPPLRAQVHGQIARALKPGGVFVLEGYTPQQLQFKTGGPGDVAMLYTRAQLQAELRGLQWVHAAELERTLHEGQGHNGTSAVVQIVARKPVAGLKAG
ncbi:cyclopropane-fatty-acyl-phospholipid synthase family protein [Sinimarinibacterium sp. NLF-5-8]|uniref:SAM-dependent methyltransferase n=1 Tax=Sinimarinibacterium sp. NLF-5-8 TaxID=2698684 RepID=UPI00192E958A|nr:class I SAM-dependent methyltransferase [Sinimarinibacterium sp. NLF-5-8]